MYWASGRPSYDPFSDFRRIQEQVNRLFEGAGRPGSESFPAVNIWSNDDEVVLTAEIPGLSLDNLNLSVLREQLSIEGEVRSEEPAKEVVFHRRERSSGKFYRGFKLPYEIDGDKVKATYKDGVLQLNLPRAEVSKPRKINVSAG